MMEVNWLANDILYINIGTTPLGELVNETLLMTQLDVACDKIFDDIIMAVSEYFQYNSTLQKLGISWSDNHLLLDTTVSLSSKSNSDTRKIVMSALLQNNNTSLSLNLFSNNMWKGQSYSIGECLNGDVLQCLNVLENKITLVQVIKTGETIEVKASLSLSTSLLVTCDHVKQQL